LNAAQVQCRARVEDERGRNPGATLIDAPDLNMGAARKDAMSKPVVRSAGGSMKHSARASKWGSLPALEPSAPMAAIAGAIRTNTHARAIALGRLSIHPV